MKDAFEAFILNDRSQLVALGNILELRKDHYICSKFQEFNAHGAAFRALATGQKDTGFLQEVYGWCLLHCLLLDGRGLLRKCSPTLGLRRAPHSRAPYLLPLFLRVLDETEQDSLGAPSLFLVCRT